jgi:hypothetical protein
MSQTLRIHYSFTIDYLIDLECDEIHSNHLIGPPRTSRPNHLTMVSGILSRSVNWVNETIGVRFRIGNIVTRPTSTSRRATEHCFNHKAGFSRTQKIGVAVFIAFRTPGRKRAGRPSPHLLYFIEAIAACIVLGLSNLYRNESSSNEPRAPRRASLPSTKDWLWLTTNASWKTRNSVLG